MSGQETPVILKMTGLFILWQPKLIKKKTLIFCEYQQFYLQHSDSDINEQEYVILVILPSTVHVYVECILNVECYTCK